MTTPAPITGTCLCGSLTLIIAAGVQPSQTMTCYCTDCQKNSGGPYQTNALFSTSDISVSDPTSQLKTFTITEGTTSGLPKDKGFCGKCGCTLYTRPGHYKGMTVVKTGILDGDWSERFPPAFELFARDRAAFCKPIEGTKQFVTVPEN